MRESLTRPTVGACPKQHYQLLDADHNTTVNPHPIITSTDRHPPASHPTHAPQEQNETKCQSRLLASQGRLLDKKRFRQCSCERRRNNTAVIIFAPFAIFMKYESKKRQRAVFDDGVNPGGRVYASAVSIFGKQ